MVLINYLATQQFLVWVLVLLLVKFSSLDLAADLSFFAEFCRVLVLKYAENVLQHRSSWKVTSFVNSTILVSGSGAGKVL
jgi:hypothetical protein